MKHNNRGLEDNFPLQTGYLLGSKREFFRVFFAKKNIWSLTCPAVKLPPPKKPPSKLRWFQSLSLRTWNSTGAPGGTSTCLREKLLLTGGHYITNPNNAFGIFFREIHQNYYINLYSLIPPKKKKWHLMNLMTHWQHVGLAAWGGCWCLWWKLQKVWTFWKSKLNHKIWKDLNLQEQNTTPILYPHKKEWRQNLVNGKFPPFPAVENHNLHLNFGGGGPPHVLETSSLLGRFGPQKEISSSIDFPDLC